MTTLFVDQLTVIDASYLCPQRGLVGESWIVDLELGGTLDGQSMVLDFGLVKKQLKKVIDNGPDHTLIVPALYTGCQNHTQADGRIQTHFKSDVGTFVHTAPACAVTLLAATEVNAATLAAHLLPQIKPLLLGNVAHVKIHLRSETIADAFYHYSHGLKKHHGACQRIAHGHRSRIQILVDGLRHAALEQLWSARFNDKYLYTGADEVQLAASPAAETLLVRYQAPEGEFELQLPRARSYCIGTDTDTTVEEIAEHLLAQIHSSLPAGQIQVRAFEGVMKGAIARTN